MSDSLIAAADRGLLYGDGLFETMRVVSGRIPLLSRHLARLSASAALIRLPVPPDVEGRCASAAASLGEGALRLTVTRGAGRRGYDPPTDPSPTVLVQTSPYTPPDRPWRAIIAQTVQVSSTSLLWRIKSLSALEKVLARQEAVQAGADEALLLNEKGALAEGAASNLFLVIDGEPLTPPLRAGCLPGVARGLLLEQGAREADLSLADLERASEAFVTNALAGVVPLRMVGDRPFEPGPVAAQMAALYSSSLRA